MKLRLPFITTVTASALLATSPAMAQTDGQASADDVELPSGPDGPPLWKVADEDTTIYLFGTVHALDPSVVWYDAEIDAALMEADTVVTEILMDPQSEARMMQLSAAMGVFTDGTTLRSLLTEEQTTAYTAALGSMGIPAEAFDQFKPWMAGLTLALLPVLTQGYDLNAGVDKVILARSGDTSKEALETIEFQLGIFDGMPQDQQIAFLMGAVEGMDETKQLLDSMVAEWLDGDAEGLAAIMNEDLEEDAGLGEALLYSRNANWAEWIDTRMDDPGTVFIAVGAGHLAGRQSVQEYLAERDIAVERIQ